VKIFLSGEGAYNYQTDELTITGAYPDGQVRNKTTSTIVYYTLLNPNLFYLDRTLYYLAQL